MQNISSSRRRSNHGAGRWIIGISLLLGGCSNPFKHNDYVNFSVPSEALQTIEAKSLADHSKSDPVKLEDVPHYEEYVAPILDDRIILSIAEVRAAALANNLELQVELIRPSIAQATVDEEEAKFESTFNFIANRQKIDSPTTDASVASKATIDTLNAGIDIPLRSGGILNINMRTIDQETNAASSFVSETVNSDLTFSISQPIFRNAGEYVNTHSIRVAKYQQQITTARTKLEAIRILANADRAYWRLYAARRELDVRVQQYDLAMRQLEQARRRVQAGDSAQIEITRAESGLSSRLEGIIIAQTLVNRSQRNLKRIINREDLPMDSETSVFLSTGPEPLGLDLDAERIAQNAVENRMEMLELELQLAIDASSIDLAKNRKLPLVTLDYNYNINGIGRTYADSFNLMADKNFEDWSAGVSVAIPLGNEQAEARLHRAILDRLQRLATKEQRAQAIEQEVYEAIDQLEQNWQRIIAARQSTILALRTYEAEQRQFEVGVRTSTDVLDAAANLADAQTREILALTDFQISQIDIAFATGTLLGHNKVRWEAVDIDALEYE
ncbi:MAG: TolC family protein [Planctomycetota bacterium]|nr:TolC family protein [Planctomycetota bacterium]